jgi:hypothetical protein
MASKMSVRSMFDQLTMETHVPPFNGQLRIRLTDAARIPATKIAKTIRPATSVSSQTVSQRIARSYRKSGVE